MESCTFELTLHTFLLRLDLLRVTCFFKMLVFLISLTCSPIPHRSGGNILHEWFPNPTQIQRRISQTCCDVTFSICRWRNVETVENVENVENVKNSRDDGNSFQPEISSVPGKVACIDRVPFFQP